MRSSTGFSTKVGGIDTQACAAFWRRVHPHKTAECVAAALRAPVRTVENWLAFVAAPSLRLYLRAVKAYGPEFAAETIDDPDEWVIEAARQAKRERLARTIAALEAELTDAALGEGGP